MKIVWFNWWEKGNSSWDIINGDNCWIFNISRVTIGIQKPHTWKHL